MKRKVSTTTGEKSKGGVIKRRGHGGAPTLKERVNLKKALLSECAPDIFEYGFEHKLALML